MVALFPPAADRHPARLIPFVVAAPAAERVAIVGDFNDWDPQATPLTRLSGTAWGVVVKLAPGRYRYAFVLDGARWIADPGAPRAGGDDFGVESSVATVLARGL
jgi:1,4-alpha-glucan branching enzyme